MEIFLRRRSPVLNGCFSLRGKKFFMKSKHKASSNRFQVTVILFIILSLIGMINFTRGVAGHLAEGLPGKYAFFFIMETTGAYTILFLLPALMWFFGRFPLKKNKLAERIPLYLFASVVFGVSHTLLMYITRQGIYWLIGWGTYDYGIWQYRFLMEYSHQVITFFGIYFLIVFLKSQKEKQEQSIKMARLEEKLAKARLQSLEMQLNPHFFFNTLNMISSTMYEDIKTADKMIADLSDILRFTLKSSSGDTHTLEKELDILNLYTEIMKARFGDKLHVQTGIGAGTENAVMPRFLLQPLVENAIKHGFENPGRTEIRVGSRLEGGRLVLEISDNGPGLPEGPGNILRQGIGLSNTRERLEQLYGDEHRFLLQNRKEGGLLVRIVLPFRPL